MEPGSRAVTSEEPPAYESIYGVTSYWSNLLGTLIALLTLTLPVGAIAYFSARNPLLLPPATSQPLNPE